MGLVDFTIEIDTTQLRDIKLEVVPDSSVEIWIYSAFLQVFNRASLMCI